MALCRELSTPTPSGLVSVSGRPARAASLRSNRFGSPMPVTAIPYSGSGESMVCPPATGQPASRATAAPPRSTSASRSRSSTARGQPTRLIASTHSPPIAQTSDIAFAATMRPQSNGSSTTGVKKSAVLITARPASSRTTAASSPSSPTSRSGPPGRSTPASSRSSSPIGTLQAHPPPAAYCVIRTVMGTTLTPPRIPSPAEAYRRLVALPVFNTGEVEQLGLVGSIPIRLRQT